MSYGEAMLDTWSEQVRFVRSLKGPAASILFVLMLSGRACTGQELELATNYSDKSVKDGLALLTAEGLVQYNGKFNGWSLGSGFYQLPLPFQQLSDGAALLVAGIVDGGNGAALPVADVVGGGVTEPHDRKFSDHGPLLSSSFIDHRKNDLEEEEERAQSRKNSEVLGLLVAAGAAPKSSAVKRVLALDLDPAYVRAHVQHRAALLEQGQLYPVGWLINKLECGDPAPAPKQGVCPDCGRPMVNLAYEGFVCRYCETAVS